MADLFEAKADDWDESQMRLQLSNAIAESIKNLIDLNDDMEVMDFGAGTGLVTFHILPGVKSITAIDTSESMLNKLLEKSAGDPKVNVICQDILTQSLDTEFDLIISAMAMHHVENTNALIRTLANHLRPGGQIALADLDKEDGTFHPEDTEGVYHHGFVRSSLQSTLEESGFEKVRFATAHTITKDAREYPIFLVIASKK